ncbi:MAG: OmpH family outer membrane protein [Succinivibrionaceae bacterium]
MKKVISAAILAATMMFGPASASADDSKVGFVSIPDIYNSIPQMKALDEKLEKIRATKGKSIEKLQNELVAKQKTLEDPGLATDQRSKIQREAQLLQTELQVKVSELREEQQKIFSKEKVEIDKKIQEAIDKVAKEKNLSLVLNAIGRNGEPYVLYAEESANISNAVIEVVKKLK